MRESAVWAKFKGLVEKYMPDRDWLITRIETGSTVLGFPDVLFIRNGRVTFIELKSIEGNTVALRPQQVNMLEILHRMGCNVAVVGYKEATGRMPAGFYAGTSHFRDIEKQGILSAYVRYFETRDIIGARHLLHYINILPLDK